MEHEKGLGVGRFGGALVVETGENVLGILDSGPIKEALKPVNLTTLDLLTLLTPGLVAGPLEKRVEVDGCLTEEYTDVHVKTSQGEAVVRWARVYPAAAVSLDSTSNLTLHPEEIEIIYGVKGGAVLSLLPKIRKDREGFLSARRGKPVKLPLTRGTLVVVPAGQAPNCWTAIDEPCFTMVYVTLPRVYEEAKRVSVRLVK